MSANKQAGLARFGLRPLSTVRQRQCLFLGIQWCSSRLMVVVVLDMYECLRIIKVIKSIRPEDHKKYLMMKKRIYSISIYSSRGRGTLETEEHSYHYG